MLPEPPVEPRRRRVLPAMLIALVLGLGGGVAAMGAFLGLTAPVPSIAAAIDGALGRGCEVVFAMSPTTSAENQGTLAGAGEEYVRNYEAEGYQADIRIIHLASGQVRGVVFGIRCPE